jgi:hypothetical protein
MTGNKFHPEIVERIIELTRTGETDLRGVVHREYPVLTRLGIERAPISRVRRSPTGIGRGGQHDGDSGAPGGPAAPAAGAAKPAK